MVFCPWGRKTSGLETMVADGEASTEEQEGLTLGNTRYHGFSLLCSSQILTVVVRES